MAQEQGFGDSKTNSKSTKFRPKLYSLAVWLNAGASKKLHGLGF